MLTGLLLAAGGSRRLSQPKQLLDAGGLTLVQRAVRALAEVCDAVVVVTGAAADQTNAALANEPCRIVHNPDWSSGQGSSLAKGLDTCEGEAVLIWVVDQPEVGVADLARLRSLWQNAPTEPVAAAYAGIVGVPAIVPLGRISDTLMLEGDRGLRGWLRGLPSLRTVEIPAAATDIDTPADVERWQSRHQ